MEIPIGSKVPSNIEETDNRIAAEECRKEFFFFSFKYLYDVANERERSG